MDVRVLILPTAIALAGYRVWRLRARGVGVSAALGLSLDARSLVDVLAGALMATLSLSAVFLVEWRTGLLTFQGVGPPTSLVTDLSTPIVVAFVEECVFRCALLGVLPLWTSVPLAVALSAAVFAVVHAGNSGVSLLAIGGYVVAGVVYGVAFVKTERIWLPFGLHLGWNYAEGRLLGFAVSGGPLPGSVHPAARRRACAPDGQWIWP